MLNRYRTFLMAEADPPAQGTPPAPPAAAPAPPAATPPAAAAPAAGEDFKAMTLEQFNARLSKERELATKGLLKETGFSTLDEAKSFYAKAREAEEAKKTSEQKMQEKIAALEPLPAEVKKYEELVDSLLTVELAEGIPEAKKALVEKLAPAGDKPEQKRERLLWIRKAKAEGLFKQDAPTAPEVKPPAQSRAGNGNPPPPAPPPGQKHPRDMTPDEFKVYERQKLAERTAR